MFHWNKILMVMVLVPVNIAVFVYNYSLLGALAKDLTWRRLFAYERTRTHALSITLASVDFSSFKLRVLLIV